MPNEGKARDLQSRGFERLLNLEEAASVLGMHWKTLERLAHERKVPALERTGRRGIADRFCYASVLFLSLIRINLCASGFVCPFGRFDDRDDRRMSRNRYSAIVRIRINPISLVTRTCSIGM
jgi:hypothetical protein